MKKFLEEYDRLYPNFKWFIEDYFPIAVEKLELCRNNANVSGILSILNMVWFQLPDDQFNIIENPDGWNDFMYLLENF